VENATKREKVSGRGKRRVGTPKNLERMRREERGLQVRKIGILTSRKTVKKEM